MTWITIPDGSDFPIENLPVGVVRIAGRHRVVTRVGDSIVPLGDIVDDPMFERSSANEFLGAGPAVWERVRGQVRDWVDDHANARPLVDVREVDVCLPVTVGDYVDFYSSIHHATRVGRLFRPDAEPLLPNWRHLPVGYHGRTSTIVVDGAPIVRPTGLVATDGGVERQPCRQLDYEAEVGFVVGAGNDRNRPVAPADADQHVFGVVLVNDWSARDIQAFEYQPLGPHLGKSFATTISPWIVPLAALAPFRTSPPPQEPRPDRALTDPGDGAISLSVEARLNGTTICRTDLAQLYWTFAQQYAHLTSNGASTRAGDLFATGTVSGAADGEAACLLEATRRGAEPITLDDGSTRAWLEDGDSVELRASAENDDIRIGFGRATGTVEAARP